MSPHSRNVTPEREFNASESVVQPYTRKSPPHLATTSKAKIKQPDNLKTQRVK